MTEVNQIAAIDEMVAAVIMVGLQRGLAASVLICEWWLILAQDMAVA